MHTPDGFKLALVLFISLKLCVNSQNEEKSPATAIASMEELLETERLLIQDLDAYAEELERKVNLIRRGVAEMRQINERASKNAEEYLSNPINSFSFIRRLHDDWMEWENYLTAPSENLQNISRKRADLLPSAIDLKEAAFAIHRLQQTYDLQQSDIAKGLLNGQQYDTNFTAKDCYTIGRVLFEDTEPYMAGFWTYTALQLFQPNEVWTALGFRKPKILALYSDIMLMQNRRPDALQTIHSALNWEPRNEEFLNKAAKIQMLIEEGSVSPTIYPKANPDGYLRGCRGEFDAIGSYDSDLRCRYNTSTTAFLRLAPLKMEQISLEPYFVLYHDVLTENEMSVLKRMARPSLQRATVYSEKEGKSVVVRRRTSKFAWFADDTNDVTKRVNQRINDMTGFDLKGSELLQVMNYGVGGHYETHFDFFNTTDSVVATEGDRISTVLFYMSDVVQGGATVFPNIEKAIYPRKGSAVVWYNLDNRGRGDGRTLHAACPVLVGSKWVCNKWIRERNQLFTRPCYKE